MEPRDMHELIRLRDPKHSAQIHELAFFVFEEPFASVQLDTRRIQ